jgi:hypothetical protein
MIMKYINGYHSLNLKASRKTIGYPNHGEAKSTLRDVLLFQKRSKSVSSASQKTIDYAILGDTNPTLRDVLLFQVFRNLYHS